MQFSSEVVAVPATVDPPAAQQSAPARQEGKGKILEMNSKLECAQKILV